MDFYIKGTERIFCIGHSIVDNLNKYVAPSVTYTRPSTKFIGKQCNGNKLIGVEVGVREGYNAKSMLTQLPIKKLYLVDPFKPYMENGLLKEGVSFDIADKNLSKFKDKIEFIKQPSDKAIDYIPNNLDFVYIDGCHEPEYVKQDMELWYPKIKTNGILAGHDIHDSEILRVFISFVKNDDVCHVLDKDWWIVKKDKDVHN